MKIKFNSDDDDDDDDDDDLPLNKPRKFHAMTIISVFEEDDKLYPQVFLDDALCEHRVQKTLVAKRRIKCQNTIKSIFLKELILIKQLHQKNVIFVTIGISKILGLSKNRIVAMVAMI